MLFFVFTNHCNQGIRLSQCVSVGAWKEEALTSGYGYQTEKPAGVEVNRLTVISASTPIAQLRPEKWH